MLAREVSRTTPGVHRQSFEDDARGGSSVPRAYALPPRRVIICDAPEHRFEISDRTVKVK